MVGSSGWAGAVGLRICDSVVDGYGHVMGGVCRCSSMADGLHSYGPEMNGVKSCRPVGGWLAELRSKDSEAARPFDLMM